MSSAPGESMLPIASCRLKRVPAARSASRATNHISHEEKPMSHSDAETDHTAEASSGAGVESGPGGRTRLGDRSVARIGYGAMQLERLQQDRSTGVADRKSVGEG